MSSKRPPMFLAGIVPAEEDFVKRVQQTLTSAQLKDLVAHPIQLLPTPGATKYYAVLAMFAFYNFVSAAYVQHGSSYIGPLPIDFSQSYCSIAGLLDQAADSRGPSGPGFIPAPAAPWVNAPLRIGLDAGTDLTGGDGTLDVVIYYTIEDAT